MDISICKLIIFDLDETLWNGILTEDTAVMPPEHIRLLRDMVDAGVMCSICSKNDRDTAYAFLKDNGIDELFVFSSINWSSKGQRVRQIVQEMHLRDCNVLFVDDNPTNRGEVKALCPDMMVEDVDVIPDLIAYFSEVEKKDLQHTRLQQYKLLEKKNSFKATVGSNEDFLAKCNIKVEIIRDCMPHLDRIADLILRSNQINFTKLRSTREELQALLASDTAQCGCVSVHDDFGDYGIAGFYALEQGQLKHFVFSCRVLNMGVEQYVYKLLGKPRLTVVGSVSSDLQSVDPVWINSSAESQRVQKSDVAGKRILVKGPCDMLQLFSFIKQSENIVTEFVFVNDKGIAVEQGNHTLHIVEALTLDEATKNALVESLPFGDKAMFNTAIYDEFDFILLSLFTDPSMGVYREKATGAKVTFGEYIHDMTDETLWPKYKNREIYSAEYTFSEEELKFMKENYTYCGRVSPEEIVENLDFIYKHIYPGARLILSLGVEIAHEKNEQPAYNDRHLYNRQMNQAVRAWAEGKDRVVLLDVNPFITSQDAFTNNINHFSKTVYYKLSQELVRIINENGMSNIKMKSLLRYAFDKGVNKIKRKLKKR